MISDTTVEALQMMLPVRWVQYLVPVFFILLYHFLHVMVSSNNLGKKKMNTGNN